MNQPEDPLIRNESNSCRMERRTSTERQPERSRG